MTAETRLEPDSMGALEVPAQALRAGRRQRAIENFPATGLKVARGFVLRVAAEMTDLSREELRRLRDPRTLIKGEVGGGG
jgi:fumarate hydratase class II